MGFDALGALRQFEDPKVRLADCVLGGPWIDTHHDVVGVDAAADVAVEQEGDAAERPLLVLRAATEHFKA